MKGLIVPAIIAKTQENLDKLIEKLPKSSSRVMLDIMDGHFVPNHSLDFDFTLTNTCGLKYEAHLMVSRPSEFIKKIVHKVDIITVHFESKQDISKVIQNIKKNEKEAYLAISPKTEVTSIKNFLGDIDGVLVMTVVPGKYGSKFLEFNLEKVRLLRKIAPDLSIGVDGGMNPDNALKASLAGADIIASGSFIMKSNDPDKAFELLGSVFEKRSLVDN
jgi:ribulose-phosphate 3-epimerase